MAIGRTRARAACLALLLTLTADLPAPASAQMLWNHEEWRYVNYARQGYRPYTGGVWSELRRPAFDELGNYLMQGVQVFRTEEARENDPLAGSLVDESVEYRINLNRLVIGHDSYGDRSSRIMVGDFIRTKFSALTLDLASLNGVRWDIDLNPTQITLVSSRMDWPIFPSGRLLARTDRDNEAHRERRWSTYLLGGHVERRFGALNLGFNYVNLHRTDSLVDWGDNNIRGVLPSAVNRPPAWIAVRVDDGSDEDEVGARVHEMRIKNPELAHVEAAVTLHDTEVIDQAYPNGDEFFPQGRRIPPYVQFLKGEFPPAQRRAEGYYQADGTEYLIFWFQIPHELRDHDLGGRIPGPGIRRLPHRAVGGIPPHRPRDLRQPLRQRRAGYLLLSRSRIAGQREGPVEPGVDRVLLRPPDGTHHRAACAWSTSVPAS